MKKSLRSAAFFRTDTGTSEKLVQAIYKAGLMMISHLPLIRDSGWLNSWLQEMISCLIDLRNDDRTAWHGALILHRSSSANSKSC